MGAQLQPGSFIWHIENCSIKLNKKMMCTYLVDSRTGTLNYSEKYPELLHVHLLGL
jgi:hypothetical protein